MQMEIRLKYSWIKQRRKDVLQFLQENYWVEKDTNSKTKIEDDLGITGDDAAELIQKFEQQFHVNMNGLNFTEYFYCEGEGTDIFPINLFHKLILLPFAVLILPFSFATFKEMIFYNPLSNITSEKKSLFVGDLITSSFTNKFTLQRDVVIKLI